MSQYMPTVGSLVLRALARRADHLAFRQGDREFSGRATTQIIARMQRVISETAARGSRVALLGGNRTEIWCAGIAAQLSGMVVSWLHPLASLDNQRAQLEAYGVDLLIVDAVNHGARGGELAADPQIGCKHLVLGPAGHAPDLLALCEQAGRLIAPMSSAADHQKCCDTCAGYRVVYAVDAVDRRKMGSVGEIFRCS